MVSLAGKTIFMTGGSRGIGLAIAVRAARDGANVAIAAKTADPNPKLPGTIYSAAKEIEAAGGKALPLQVDIREEESVKEAIAKTAATFGGIDILVNNASAINLKGTLATTMKKFDLMNTINGRGTFVTSQAALPYLMKAKNPHVLTLSPPLDLDPRWIKYAGVAYTMAKFNMSFTVLGMSEEFRNAGVAFNALWPRTAISTAAVRMLAGRASAAVSRNVDIMSDAAHHILTRPSSECTGNFFIDEDVLRSAGMSDKEMEKYKCVSFSPLLMPDLFVGDPADFSKWDRLRQFIDG